MPRNYDSEIATVRNITTVVAAALAAINSIPDRIAAALAAFKADNPDADTSALDAELASASAAANDLAAAVAANTPAAQPAPVVIPPGSGEESTGAVAQQPSNGGAEDQTHDQAAQAADPEPQA